jgi:hypothetical protein
VGYVLVVVFTILYVIPAHYFDLTNVCILLPLVNLHILIVFVERIKLTYLHLENLLFLTISFHDA